jgi:VIT1/CCC1 family predicted Fe2+/Mn2+ transporter
MLSDMRGYTKKDVEHMLMQAVEDQRRAAKKWSIPTYPSTINVGCEVTAVTGVLGAVGFILAGAVPPIVPAILLTASLGQALISIRKGRKQFIQNSRVNYLMRLQDAAAKAA